MIASANGVFDSDDESADSDNELQQGEEELNEQSILTVFQCFHLSIFASILRNHATVI